MNAKKLFKPLAMALTIASLSGVALAAPVVYNEVRTGDALGSAEFAGDAGSLVIRGNLLDGRGGFAPNVSDLYRITVSSAGNYVFNTFGSTVADPTLFLFDNAGNGLYFNNDASLMPVDTQSSFSAVLGLGDYYLGFAFYAVDPDDGAGSMFDTLGSNEGGPVAGALSLTQWVNYSAFTGIWDNTAYRINVRLPEPGALALSLVALGLLAGFSRRRQGSPA